MDLNLGSVFPVLETKTLSSLFLLLIWTLRADSTTERAGCLISVFILWKFRGVSECWLFSSVPIHPGEIKGGRMGWAEISVAGLGSPLIP